VRDETITVQPVLNPQAVESMREVIKDIYMEDKLN